MSYLVFDFECKPCKLLNKDMLVHSSEKDNVPCPLCGETMERRPALPKIDWASLAMGESASPEAIAHFERVHRERAALEEKSYTEHGDFGSTAGA